MAPIVRSLPSYVKDSQHALQIFRDFNFLGEDKLIFTMDITSLYTVIPNGEGLLALKHFFDSRTVKEPSSETLQLVLTLNCFYSLPVIINKSMVWPWVPKWDPATIRYDTTLFNHASHTQQKLVSRWGFLGFHLTSPMFPYMGIRHVGAPKHMRFLHC